MLIKKGEGSYWVKAGIVWYTSSRFCITKILGGDLAKTGLFSMLGWGRKAGEAKLFTSELIFV